MVCRDKAGFLAQIRNVTSATYQNLRAAVAERGRACVLAAAAVTADVYLLQRDDVRIDGPQLRNYRI